MAKDEDVQKVPDEKFRVLTNAEVSRQFADVMEGALNESSAPAHGIRCLEYKVLVRPITDDGTIKLKGGGVLYKPDETKERDDAATMEGVVVEMSPLAFSYEDGAPRPHVGDTVMFQRYAGLRLKGNDEVEYRLMNDKDVVAVRRRA